MPSVRQIALPALLAALALLLACSEGAVTPETGVVRGQVLRIYSDEVVAGARIEVGGEVAVTDGEGRFLFKRVMQGAATVRVSADTYRDLARAITVSEYQSFSFELTPLDSLFAISGRVLHRIDGPQRVRVDHDLGSVWTDGDGRWNLTDVPLGPFALSIDQPPYNRFATEVLVHAEGQEFTQTLTRDTTVTWQVDHDAYVFMRDDSLNANRGHVPVLLVTEDLGRTAIFSLTLPAPDYAWTELVEASLELHGRRDTLSALDPGDPLDLTVRLIGLDGPFLEGAVDFFNRPGFFPYGDRMISLADSPVNQRVVLDILPVIRATPASFRSLGIGIGASEEQAPIRLLSSDHGTSAPEIEDRPRVTYRLRI